VRGTRRSPQALEAFRSRWTDRIILTDVVTRAGHSLDDGLLEQLRDRYIDNLRLEIEAGPASVL
jgi:hypothetical protein